MKTSIEFYFEHDSEDLKSIQDLSRKFFADLLGYVAAFEEASVQTREEVDMLEEDLDDQPDPVAVSKGA